MQRCLWLVFIFCFTSARADIFQDSKDGELSSALNPFEYGDQNIPIPLLSAFNFKENLFNQVQTPLFNRVETQALMQSVSRSPLMLWQYSSPAGADLFKHYQITGNLRLDMFYRQIEDMQRRMGGDLGVLLDQARMECLEHPRLDGRGKPDLVKTILSCSDRRPVFTGQTSSGILGKILNRLHVRGERKEMITAIVPEWALTSDGYQMNGPAKRIGNVFADHRDGFLEKLRGLAGQYRARQSVDPDDLREMSLPGIPLTERSLRDWLALDAPKADLVLGKVASQLAYIKSMEQYDTALEFLNRALTHPSIREGYKMIVRQALDFVVREKNSLASYREGLDGYAAALSAAADASEQRRLEIIRDLAGDRHEY